MSTIMVLRGVTLTVAATIALASVLLAPTTRPSHQAWGDDTVALIIVERV